MQEQPEASLKILSVGIIFLEYPRIERSGIYTLQEPYTKDSYKKILNENFS